MKQILFLIACCAAVQPGFAQNQQPARAPEQIQAYWFVMLMRGPNRSHDSVTAAELQKGHMANINRLYNEGKLKVAGPFADGKEWLGIFIFDASAPGCKTKEEIEALLKTDPAIAAGRLSYDVRPWWTAPEGSFKPGIPDKKY